MTKVSDSKTADGSSSWFKIFQDTWGKLSSTSSGSDDYWGTKDLNTNCGKMDVKIPAGLAAGDYLLRAEAIALHSASGLNGAQFYITCFQLTVTGSGSTNPAGVSLPGAYKATDPGIQINIYQQLSTYIAPGPSVIAGGTVATAGKVGSIATVTGGGASSTAAAVTTTAKASSTLATSAQATATSAAAFGFKAPTPALVSPTPYIDQTLLIYCINRYSNMANQPAPRRGHLGIRTITEDMVDVLPPENTSNIAYMRIHTTFGLMKGCLDNAEQGKDPAKQYKELQKLEETLRKRPHDLKAKKGIPPKMQSCLDELRDAIKEALEQGVDMDFVIKAFEDMVVAPEPTLAEKEARKPPRMVSEKRLKEVWNELKEEKAKNKKLNEENNELAIKLKRAEAEMERWKGRCWQGA
ncbi:hypothetical protein N0V90_003019 [Kalmusia sp. IMI 367209]|nr:hypothetical protein N0V90_003019 [Kalmusia sp. IMI 367209]